MDNFQDYSKYTLEQLYDVYNHIDREKYPDRFKVIVDWIEKRKAEPDLKIKVVNNKIDKALRLVETYHKEGRYNTKDILDQLTWCRKRVLDESIEPLTCFSMGEIATHEFDTHGCDTNLAILINEIEQYFTETFDISRTQEGIERIISISDIKTERYGLSNIISIGWQLYHDNFRSILPIVLIFFLPTNILLSLSSFSSTNEASSGASGWVYILVSILCIFLIYVIPLMSLAKLLETSALGIDISWQQALRHALSRWSASVGTNILATLIVLAFSLLLIVPGIIWWVYYCFGIYVVAVRDLSGKTALNYSKRIVRGQWGRVFGYLLAIGFLGLITSVVVRVPFLFLPDHLILKIISDTMSNIIGAMFLCMNIVLFLNLDYLNNKELSEESI